ncbi:hypothetical protein CMQ_6785 [Grosmannia clavigera kw1407]|uniref:Uncharacterized protein n=1 Tax=Grosmannia clavigera (strain kw1407 / UAMH 11150) TaxID=655863 RepID=F0X779_GROCL|nr:uncharacterized protein CMQ_6785 [Grosmannia clavigera kw1407]EFX06464.1 hypothetical protein CMQ_6785 [Grosmannia clavigera kw1407]
MPDFQSPPSFATRIPSQAASSRSPLAGGSTQTEFPNGPEDAKKHIDFIWYKKQKYVGDGMIQGLLNLASKGQNSKSTHFIYELLQNADDASYGGNVPRVCIRYDTTNRTFLIESNEIGFTKADVESICSAAESTKSKKMPAASATATTERSIGEKGLGFKSVFLAADKVWISSGHYSFRFDGETPVGQIQPIWDTQFPGLKTDGFTAKLLHIPIRDRADTLEALVEELKALQALDLLFLRKVKRIEIEDCTQGHKDTAWHTKLRVDAIPRLLNILTPVRVYKDDDVESFVVFRYRVTELPITSERFGTMSDIILAFPSNVPAATNLPTKSTYAFLPISTYGFKIFGPQSDVWI